MSKHPYTFPAGWAEDIRKATDIMLSGGIILYPTDTIWGIGCDATNPEAVARIYAIKQRQDSKALITLVDSDFMVQQYIDNVPEVAWQLIECTTKPTTIIYDGAHGVAHNLLAEDGTLAMRITTEEFSRQLCRRMRRPIVSTSANISGKPSPRNFAQISKKLIGAVDYVCTSRRDERINPTPSSIIRLTADAQVSIIRS